MCKHESVFQTGFECLEVKIDIWFIFSLIFQLSAWYLVYAQYFLNDFNYQMLVFFYIYYSQIVQQGIP